MADVLIVEDDDDIAFLTQEFLELDGHHVRRAPNGEKGLANMSDGALPDLVVTDVEMPILTGPGMAARMLAEDCGRERIPIVIISGASDLIAIARRVGTPYYLAKPFEPSDMLAVVARALSEGCFPQPQPQPQPQP
jgi:CheY-like chemotaxis protein